MLTSGGMQWRIAGLLSGTPFTTLHSRFARWSRLGLWRRLGQRLAFDWRLACGDAVLPSAVVVDSRSLRSSPSAWARGFDGGKLVKGTKLLVVCDKHGALLDLEPHPANTDDRAGLLPALPRLAALGFEGNLLGDRGLKGALRRGGAGTRHPCLGLARWHAGRALPAARDPLGGCLIAAPLVNASFALAASTAGSWLSPRSALMAATTCVSRRCPSMWNARSGRPGRKTHPGVAPSASRRGRLRPPGQRISCMRCVMRRPGLRPTLARPGTAWRSSTWRAAPHRSYGPRPPRRA
jgi:hypothetical protein